VAFGGRAARQAVFDCLGKRQSVSLSRTKARDENEKFTRASSPLVVDGYSLKRFAVKRAPARVAKYESRM